MNGKNIDIVIVGAGIIGLSIAWQISRRSNLKVVVLEKGLGVGEGSTGASSSVCRFRYSSDDMVRLARDGIGAYRNWREFTELVEPRAEYHEDGVLWMPGDDLGWADREHQRMRQMGIATQVLDGEDIQSSFPSLSTCTIPPDLETGESHLCSGKSRNLLECQGGWVDPVAAAQDLVEACRRQGVDVRFRTRVVAIETGGGKVQGVSLESGEVLNTALIVNAAGPWCQQLFDLAGLEHGWDIKPIRIQILHRDRPAELGGHIPATADMSGGIYFRTENRGQQLIVGSIMEEDESEVVADPDRFQTEFDDEFQYKVLHSLHHRLPGLTDLGRIRGYCGLYTMNRTDVHPVLGPTAIEGLWAANGFSGHGFKLAPAIGSMIAQAITGDKRDFDTSVPLAKFSLDRSPIDVDSKSVLA